MKNPYAWNIVNPELCYGRDALLSELLSGLPGSPRYSFGLAGGRRMGKTTLLRRVEQDLRGGIEQWKRGGLLVVPIYVDGLVLPRPLTASDIWAYLLSELQLALPDKPLLAHGAVNFDMFKRVVQPVLFNLSERARIICMFDEIEPIVACEWSEGFFDNWQALLSNTPNMSEYFTAVFAGAHDINALRRELTSPLRPILVWWNLHVLEYEDACELMQEPIEHQWSEIFLQQAYAETGGHPMLLQYVMQHVCAGSPEAAEQSLKQAVVKFERERRWQFGEWWERYCTPSAQRVYARLPDDGSVMTLRMLVKEFGSRETDEAIEILQHVGLAISYEEGLVCRYSGEMFRRWYRIYGTLAESALYDLELYDRLAKIGQELADKYLSAWKIYQSDIPNYSGALVEARGVLEYLLDKYAPSDQVQTASGFKFEVGRQEPTLRQRVRYWARQLYDAEYTKQIVSDYSLLEVACEQLSQLVTMAHRTTSGMAHDTATREMAYRALKQWDSILAQLLPEMPQ